MNAKQLRKTLPGRRGIKSIKKNPIFLVLDSVMDTYNIGSLFRLADAIGAQKLLLCGDIEYPPSSRIHKAAVGTENWVTWEKYGNALAAIRKLQKSGVQVIAIEQYAKAVNYLELNKHLRFPVALVVGHETDGVSKEVLKKADLVVEFPMFGVNKSFNVWGSAAIVAYKVLEVL